MPEGPAVPGLAHAVPNLSLFSLPDPLPGPLGPGTPVRALPQRPSPCL